MAHLMRKGRRCGELKLIEKVLGPGRLLWRCSCSCGAEKIVPENRLKKGDTRSCGCLKKRELARRRRTHGESRGTAEYRTWCAMLRRCRNPNSAGYKRYGGRGIKVCDRWLKFENFLEDMGRRPVTAHSIDRIDYNGGYSPENCRWATRKEQARNRGDNHLVTFRGKTRTLTEWYELREIPPLVLDRIRRGWGPKDALCTARGAPRASRGQYRGKSTVLD